MLISNKLILRLAYDGVYHGDKADEAYGWSQLYATGAEDVGGEHALVTSCTAHEHKTKNDDCHSYCQQNEVSLSESIISFVHFITEIEFVM